MKYCPEPVGVLNMYWYIEAKSVANVVSSQLCSQSGLMSHLSNH